MSDRVPVTAVAIREATLDDLDVVVELRLALLREAGRHPIYGRLRADAEQRARDLFASQLAAHGEVVYLAMVDRHVVGILRCVETRSSPLFEPPRYCYVSSVYVRPAFRRQGVLAALFDAARAWCTERGLHEMRLHHLADNDTAASAWESLGFEVVEHARMLRLR